MDKDELEKVIFHSIMKELSQMEGELSDLDVKEMIFDSFKNMPGLTVEWAEPKKFGKNKIFFGTRENILLLDMTEIIAGIRLAWKEYQESVDK